MPSNIKKEPSLLHIQNGGFVGYTKYIVFTCYPDDRRRRPETTGVVKAYINDSALVLAVVLFGDVCELKCIGPLNCLALCYFA